MQVSCILKTWPSEGSSSSSLSRLSMVFVIQFVEAILRAVGRSPESCLSGSQKTHKPQKALLSESCIIKCHKSASVPHVHTTDSVTRFAMKVHCIN